MIGTVRRQEKGQNTNTISFFPTSATVIISKGSQKSFALICNNAKLWTRQSSSVAVMQRDAINACGNYSGGVQPRT